MRTPNIRDLRAQLDKRRRWLELGVALIGLSWFAAVGVAQIRRIGDWRIDDAYISLSYAKNLATGHGLTYSAGDLRVEGYSNFLWVLVATIAYLVKPASVLTGTRWVALIAAAMLGIATFLLARRRAGAIAAALAVVLLAYFSDFARAVLSGLETVPYTMAMVIAFLLYLREPRERRRWSLFAFVPVALLRIDGIVPFGFIVGFELLSAIVERRFDARIFARWAAPALAIVAVYWLWRWRYYDLFLPTTYHAKTMVSAEDRFRGRTYLWEGVRDIGLLGPIVIGTFGLGRRPSREATCLFAFSSVQLFYASYVGGDWMPFNRFLLPAVPLVLVLFAWGVSEGWAWAKSRHWALGLAAVAAALVIARSTAVSADMRVVDSPREQWKLDYAQEVATHTQGLLAARPFVNAMIRSAGDKLVTDYGGVFAYSTNAYVIEMWGLCNREIALRGGTTGINPVYGKTCPACYPAWQPDYLHIGVPLVRKRDAFSNASQVINGVFQSGELNRVLDFPRNYAVGRVVDEASGESFFFLERRRPDRELVSRHADNGLLVEYPFEPVHANGGASRSDERSTAVR